MVKEASSCTSLSSLCLMMIFACAALRGAALVHICFVSLWKRCLAPGLTRANERMFGIFRLMFVALLVVATDCCLSGMLLMS